MIIKGEGDKPYKITSYHRFCGNTNHNDPTNTKKGGRRKWILRCSDELIDNKDYFTDMYGNVVTNTVIIRSFYDYLLSLDSKDFLKIQTPITEYQEILQEGNIDTIELFIEYMTKSYYCNGYNTYDLDLDDKTENTTNEMSDEYNAEIKHQYTMSDIYSEFKTFKTQFHIHNYEVSSLGLIKKLHIWNKENGINLIERKRVRNNGNDMKYNQFNFKELVKHFKLDEVKEDIPNGKCLIKL